MNQDKVILVAVDADCFCEGCVFFADMCGDGNSKFPCMPVEREDGKYKIWVIEDKKQ